MKSFLFAIFVVWAIEAGYARKPPKVQIYSHEPGQFDRSNVLICQVSDFHPPDITIQLLMNGEELRSATQTDLAFNPSWQFHLMRSVAFRPQTADKFICRVDHGGKITDFEWEPNM